ncbi:MAG: hypothetical protein PF440_03135 [Thiomicrorhabdus sp.]|jgi:hypothetical protein|nr:hypothetical protein [Thiomicrorhabdus sp.]
MDIMEAKTILTELSSVGIDEVVFDHMDKGTRVRGSNQEKTVVVYFEIPIIFCDKSIGIQSVNGLLSRINLFDETKASISLVEDNNGDIGTINVKQGRKKASYRCNDPRKVNAPSRVPGDLALTNENVISFDKEYVTYLSTAISAMSYTGTKAERTISVQIEDDNATVAVFDGLDDTFTDVIETVGAINTDRAVWEVIPFSRVMKQSVSAPSNADSAKFCITEHGIAVFGLENLDIVVVPMVS